MATAVHDPAAQLANIQCLAAWVQARDRTVPRANASHKKDAGSVIVFQVVDISLEARRISGRNAGTRARFAGCNDSRRVSVGVNGLLAMFVVIIILRTIRAWNILGTEHIRRARLKPAAVTTAGRHHLVHATVGRQYEKNSKCSDQQDGSRAPPAHRAHAVGYILSRVQSAFCIGFSLQEMTPKKASGDLKKANRRCRLPDQKPGNASDKSNNCKRHKDSKINQCDARLFKQETYRMSSRKMTRAGHVDLIHRAEIFAPRTKKPALLAVNVKWPATCLFCAQNRASDRPFCNANEMSTRAVRSASHAFSLHLCSALAQDARIFRSLLEPAHQVSGDCHLFSLMNLW